MELIREPEIQDLLNDSIYKYGGYKDLERTLGKLTFGFNSLANFNDIYEREFYVAHFFKNKEDWEKLMSPKVNAINKVIEFGKNYLQNIKVTCFSHSGNNNLMWSNYSNHHKGVCYCVDFKRSVSPWVIGQIPWGNVIYSSQIAKVHVYQEKSNQAMMNMEMSKVVLTKSLEWAYEKEMRFYLNQDDNFLHFKPDCLKAVIVGRAMQNKEIDEVLKLINEFNETNKTNVKILYARREANSYSLGIDSNKGFRDGSETSLIASNPVINGLDGEPFTTIK